MAGVLPDKMGSLLRRGTERRRLIEGVEVRCLSPDALFAQFLGYTWGEKAIHDLTTLHRVLGTPLPPTFG